MSSAAATSSTTTWQRYTQKFKQQPLIPIGVMATCVALIGATRKLQTGDRTSFNRWLRFRVIAQGLTVVAAVAGGWQISRDRKAARAAETEETRARVKQQEEEVRFEARLREAEEEVRRMETRSGSGSGSGIR